MADVKSRDYLWSSLVAAANANGDADALVPGQEGVAAIKKTAQPDYVFSNGRKFENKLYA